MSQNELTSSQKEQIEEIIGDLGSVSYLEDKDGVRNGLISVKVTHESQTLPNLRIKELAEIGFIVSCICGSMSDGHTYVYFERVKGTSF
jgi:hypothetical protein